MRRLALLLSVVTAVVPLPVLSQGGSLTIVRADHSAIELRVSELAMLARTSVRVTAHDIAYTFEGPDLRAVLLKAGAGPIDTLRGPLLRRVIVVSATDGYKVVLPLSDLDVTLGNLRVLLADRENGAALAATDGPWRLVIVGDSRPARWVRMVSKIELVDLPDK